MFALRVRWARPPQTASSPFLLHNRLTMFRTPFRRHLPTKVGSPFVSNPSVPLSLSLVSLSLVSLSLCLCLSGSVPLSLVLTGPDRQEYLISNNLT